MLVAVTGGTGFIGSHTVAALTRAGHRVRLLVRDAAKLKRVFEPRGFAVDDFVVGDIADPDCVGRLLDGCEALVHCAALVALDKARAAEVQSTNARGVENIVGGAVARGLSRIVYVSSAGALFRLGGPRLTGDSPVGDSSNAYGASKADGERFVRRLQDEGAPILTVYPTAVVGPDDPGYTAPNRAMAFFMDWGAPLTSTGYQLVDVRDLARMHVALLEGTQPTGRYIAAAPYYPWRDLFDGVERVTGRRLRVVPVPGALLRGIGRLMDVVTRVVSVELPLTLEAMQFATCWSDADGSPAERDLAFQYRPLEETLADTYRWLHAAGHLGREKIGRLASEPATD